jgi:hypothetical protein
VTGLFLCRAGSLALRCLALPSVAVADWDDPKDRPDVARDFVRRTDLTRVKTLLP